MLDIFLLIAILYEELYYKKEFVSINLYKIRIYWFLYTAVCSRNATVQAAIVITASLGALDRSPGQDWYCYMQITAFETYKKNVLILADLKKK